MLKLTCILLVLSAPIIAADEEKLDFTATSEQQREKALKEIEKQQAEIERDPAYIEAEKKRQADYKSALAKMAGMDDHIQARVLTVGDRYVLALVRFRVAHSKTSSGKKRFEYSDESDEPYWIQGVNTASVVDNDRLELTVYPAGKASYNAISGAYKTVRRLAVSPELALNLLMSRP